MASTDLDDKQSTGIRAVSGGRTRKTVRFRQAVLNSLQQFNKEIV
tara:strand:+ start:2488 stop:2622 length:135 start_codon:yes stop_codon:yes gene_type:complete